MKITKTKITQEKFSLLLNHTELLVLYEQLYATSKKEDEKLHGDNFKVVIELSNSIAEVL